ncbi:MAG: SRPBCC domain-containing protein [Flavitalea sp.]
MPTSKNEIHIGAIPEKVYNAFLNPDMLTRFLVPHEMTATIKDFRSGIGGGYKMVLRYPDTDTSTKGKTGEKEDGYTARFTTLEPYSKIVCLINFETTEASFKGEMTETITFHAHEGGTSLTIRFENIPEGIDPKDNVEGTASSLSKLKKILEEGSTHE